MATYQINHAGRGSEIAQAHSHDYRSASRRSLLIVLGLISCHLVIETVGGILSGSLGLLAHAAHMTTDAIAISLALFAMWIAERPATITRTFGYHRIEVLVVLVNAVALWVLASWILYESYQRFSELTQGHTHDLDGGIMLAVASTGLLINLFAAWTLYRSSRHSINVEGALWHILADLMGSIAVVISSVILLFFQWDFVDPILSVLIAALIVVGSSRLAIKVSRILLEGAPVGLDVYQLCSEIEDAEGVTLVHDVHAWTITTGYNSLAAHVLIDPDYQGDIDLLMRRLRKTIREGFAIQHVTLHMEQSATDCSEHHHVGHLEARSQFEL
jgi:cobalt-zinc-cadmium efflux system protein